MPPVHSEGALCFPMDVRKLLASHSVENSKSFIADTAGTAHNTPFSTGIHTPVMQHQPLKCTDTAIMNCFGLKSIYYFTKFSSPCLPHMAQLMHTSGTNPGAAGCSCVQAGPSPTKDSQAWLQEPVPASPGGKSTECKGRSQKPQ